MINKVHMMYLLKNLDFSTCNERHLWKKRISTTKQFKAGEFSFFVKLTQIDTLVRYKPVVNLHLFRSLLFVFHLVK
jgi:hypothetical protein